MLLDAIWIQGTYTKHAAIPTGMPRQDQSLNNAETEEYDGVEGPVSDHWTCQVMRG